MLDRLRRLAGGGTMATDLRARLARTHAEAGDALRRVALVERRMDELEEILTFRGERGRGASS